MLEREAKRRGYTLSQLMQPEWVEGILKKFGFTSLDDLYSAIGYGGISTGPVLNRLIDEYRKANKQEAEETVTKEQRSEKARSYSGNGIKVKGIDNVLIRIARCCNPVPGDPVIGYITRGREFQCTGQTASIWQMIKWMQTGLSRSAGQLRTKPPIMLKFKLWLMTDRLCWLI